jgi:hypothetical protein
VQERDTPLLVAEVRAVAVDRREVRPLFPAAACAGEEEEADADRAGDL